MPQVQQGQTAYGIAQSLGQTPQQFLDNNPNFAATGHSGDYQGLSGFITPGMTYNTGTPQTNTTSTTTISNANIQNQIPGMVNQLNNLSNTGLSTNSQGQVQYADGSFYNPSQEQDFVEADTTEEDRQYNDFLESMKTSLDAQTKSLIDNIQQRFAQRREEQKEINRRQKRAYETALLMGGATGQGSSAQYAPISSEGIIGEQEKYGLKQIADIDAEERDLIAQARAAQESGNFKIMEKKLAQVEEKRQQKIAAATELNKKIAEQNAKLREQSVQASKDLFISDLYSQGITDVASIMEQAKKSGISLTAKEASETLKNILPPGLDDLVKNLTTNGAPSEVLQKVLSSKNMSEAYRAAGGYASGGSGIIGEYNFYRAQALSSGQVPMDFNTYQNVDSNRKAKVAAAANSAGLDKTQLTRLYSLMDDYDKETKDTRGVLTASNQIDALAQLALSTNKDRGSRAASQIGMIFSFMKMLDPSSTVREGEYATAQNTAGVSDKVRNQYNKIIDGSFLTDTQINGYKSTAKAIAEARSRTLESTKKEYDRRAAISGIPEGLITGGPVSADQLVDNENEAKAKIIAFGTEKPEYRTLFTNKLNQVNPFTGQKYTYVELLEIYPEAE